MPAHDWTRVEAGIFHHFHHDWITEIARTLNRVVLPGDYYALAEQTTAETDMAFYRRKQSTVAVRHASGDRLVAMVEVVSPGNKASLNPMRSFVRKAAEPLDRGVHLLIFDLFPPGPQGGHGGIWEEAAGQPDATPPNQPLAFVAYESALSIRAYVLHAAVGEALPDMPLFLEPDQAVEVPLEATYNAAFAEVPRRWRRVLEEA